MLLIGRNVPHEQAHFYLQHYLLRHETEFTQGIQSQAQVQAKTGKAIAESDFCKISSCIWALLEVQAPKKKPWL